MHARTLRCVASALLALSPFALAAQTAFPAKPVKIQVGFAPGGTTDIAARFLALKLGEKWGQAVVVDNRPGASGMLAAAGVAKSAPDGYTLLVAPQTTMALAPALYKNIQYDTLRDFTAITNFGVSPMVLVAHPSKAYRTQADLVADARKNPGVLTYASGGNGTSLHIAGALFSHLAGVEMTHVPYRGESLAVTDVISGQVPLMFSNIPVIQPFLKAERVRALAVSSPKRSPLLPDVPTVAESGLPGFDASTWQGLFAPKGLPPEVLARIARDVQAILKDPKNVESFAAQGVELVGNSPEEFGRYVEAELKKWKEVVRVTGAKAE